MKFDRALLRPAIVVDLLESYGGPVTHAEPFRPEFYPGVYARDFMRENLPGGPWLSATGLWRRFLARRGDTATVTEEDLTRMLADCYCREHDIQIPDRKELST